MQKTGSTFLGRLLQDVSQRFRMCQVYQNTKEFACNTKLYVDCPRNSMHRKSVSLTMLFATAGPAARQTSSPAGRRHQRGCGSAERGRLFNRANSWLQDTNVSAVRYRYNYSLSQLLRRNGFLRGPLRNLYLEHEAHAVPTYAGYDNVVVVHTRHPVEMMASAYFCITSENVCPVRSRFLGKHVPLNDTLGSLDEFVLHGLQQPGSTPRAILKRCSHVADFIRQYQHNLLKDWRASAGARRGQCRQPMLVHSKYEDMVSNFSTWSLEILSKIGNTNVQPTALHDMHQTLVSRYRNDFVPDGKHKHVVRSGGNFAMLNASTVKKLKQNVELRSLLATLNYGWFDEK